MPMCITQLQWVVFLKYFLSFYFNRKLLQRRKSMRSHKAWRHPMARSILQALVIVMGIPQGPMLNPLPLILVRISHHLNNHPLNLVPHPLITKATNHPLPTTSHPRPIQSHHHPTQSHLHLIISHLHLIISHLRPILHHPDPSLCHPILLWVILVRSLVPPPSLMCPWSPLLMSLSST